MAFDDDERKQQRKQKQPTIRLKSPVATAWNKRSNVPSHTTATTGAAKMRSKRRA
jgi:hypothetical protein